MANDKKYVPKNPKGAAKIEAEAEVMADAVEASEDMAQAEQKGTEKGKKSGKEQKKENSLVEYLKGVRLEMSRVVWPTNKELGAYTAIVIVTCAAFALGFWAIDSGFLAILRAVLGITLN